ncbi:hypothetical protein R69608_06907 [Paraburkholderia nemoris]|uniref:hypothetical protein n=1 Tax=Paraburkholderia nemoris TaxID=2793076 RepID=UPI00191462EF|nr:hypothetical protein [Paraburkholderia nemoris]MBK5152391.1 hypothetical protein [Burkholderia sp. R-69608]CAE6966513.1 hypothetical protein R69608_06907 [Paraburkholderia nemoris]
MTTNINLLSSADVFLENDIVRLERSVFPADIQLGAAEWSAERQGHHDAFLLVLNFALKQVMDCLDNYEIWLLTGDSSWQADTRIVRYRKRFNSLKMQGIDFEAISDRGESMIEKGGKLKFFGAVRLDASVFSTVSLTMIPGACTYIVVKPKSDPWEFPLSAGWAGKWNDDAQMIAAIAAIGGIAFQRFGFFDDPEVGLIAIGRPDLLERIVRHVP